MLIEFLPAIGQGLATTVAISVASILGCALVSIVLGVARRSTLAPVSTGAGLFIELLRGASVLIYLFWIYYALPLLPGMPRLSPIAVSKSCAARSRPCGVIAARPRRTTRRW